MKSLRKVHSKKAQAELSLQQIIGLVLAVVIVLSTLSLFIGLMNIFIKPPSGGTAATLQTFADIVQALYDPANKNSSCYVYNFFIEENWAIAGFNADGVKSTTWDKTCKAGEKCIEERCCNGYCNSVIKPGSCGQGPCTCICNTCSASAGGGCAGSLGGKDCTKKGAVCRAFREDIGFKQFKRVSQSYCTRAVSKQYGAVKGAVKGLFGGSSKNENKFAKCDLVYEGESCKGASKKGVQYGATWKKSGSSMDFMIIDSEKERKSVATVNCRKMIRDLKKKVAPKKATSVPKTDTGKTSVTKALDSKQSFKKK